LTARGANTPDATFVGTTGATVFGEGAVADSRAFVAEAPWRAAVDVF
jgi:hypothetical protein